MKLAQEQELLAAMITALPEARQALAFAPHPDDEVFGCGGMLCLLRRAGAEVMVHVLTDGAKGGDSDDAALVASREAESRTAAEILGLPLPQFWRFPDRGLIYGELLIDKLLTTIQAADADLVILPSPVEMHPDHQALALAGIEALRRLEGDRKVAFYEIGMPLALPNLLVDISAVEALKQEAMACFVSQLGMQPYDVRVRGLNQYRGFLLGPRVSAAEAFLLLPVPALAEGVGKIFDGPAAYRRLHGYAATPDDFPLVSVVIRSMNRDSLERALNSVALQAYPHIEVVVVSAVGVEHRPLGSQCGPFPLRLVAFGQPLARSRAANAGLDNAKGSFLIFLDDDDWFYPNHIDSLVAGFCEDEAVAAVYSSVKMVDESGGELGVLAEDFDLTHLRLQNYIPIHALMFRRIVIDAGVRFDETLDVCEDWDFFLNITDYGPFKHINNVGAVYVINNENGSGVRVDVGKANNIATRIYRKWLHRWDDATLCSILDYARNKKRLENFVNSLREIGIHGNCLDSYLDNVKNIKQKADSLQLEIVELQAENDGIRKEYAEVISSKSWKITWPLRYIGQIVRRYIH